MSLQHTLFARNALLPGGWHSDVRIAWHADGVLAALTPGSVAQAGEPQAGYVIPGMVNLHSHAFQRALGGLTETAGEGPDSFWTWRDLMYRFARGITPGHIEAIAAQLFSECLRHGYTAVCEFHYVQRDPGGDMYARPAETAERVVAAAQQAGIGLTMLPVLYSYAGFGEQPLRAEQQRFRTGVDDVLRIAEALAPLRSGQMEVGAAPHSLRAAAIGQVRELMAGLPAGRPLHIHIAEQQAEVDQCLAFTGQRPVRYLMEQIAPDARWCLVHATHLDAGETAALAASGAVAGLCPTTEANLGDGIFDLPAWRAAGGVWGVGSDSHICVNAAEELLMLEYSQRLATRQRNVAADASQPNVASAMTLAAVQGGAQASGRAVGGLVVGQQADFTVLDAAHPALAGLDAPDMLSSHVFASHRTSAIDAVWVAGQPRVQGGRHLLYDSASAGFVAARRQLLQDSP